MYKTAALSVKCGGVRELQIIRCYLTVGTKLSQTGEDDYFLDSESDVPLEVLLFWPSRDVFQSRRRLSGCST